MKSIRDGLAKCSPNPPRGCRVGLIATELLTPAVAGSSVPLFEFEQFNEVARWVFEQDGSAGTAITDVAAELCIGAAQPVNQRVELRGDDHEPVPSAGCGMAACLASTASAWRAEVQGKVIAKECRELTRIVHIDLEIEIVSIELNRLVDAGNDISDRRHSKFSFGLVTPPILQCKLSYSTVSFHIFR